VKIVSVVGARPNFMKIGPIMDAFRARSERARSNGDTGIDQILVHTGQHYDHELSDLFFEQLGIPAPDVNLGVGSGTHAVQTAQIMTKFEKVCVKEQPGLVLVVGDVNSTIACALVAVKLGIPVAHVEAGLRSFDRSMPEEINRVLTDAISDYLFTTEESANTNLKREGIPPERIHFVGNVMIDTLLRHREKAERSAVLDKLGLAKDGRECMSYGVVTLHRAGTVDNVGSPSNTGQDQFVRVPRALSVGVDPQRAPGHLAGAPGN
jgi:UDP-N-acetylglucosamine 2-epimerase (non-hydrolysing)